MNTRELIGSTACAAFTTDSQGRILHWNEAAEELLGHAADDVTGQSCHDVLCGTDLFGNRFCDGACTVHNMARRGEPVHHFQMDVRHSAGGRVRAGFCTLVYQQADTGPYEIIHLLQPALVGEAGNGASRDYDRMATAPREVAVGESASAPLTAREMEVLRLLKDGVSTQSIAGALEISVTTVRNHIQGILRKLGAHSRLEAVSMARRTGII